MNISDFAGIIFDMDGLLLDSERLALETFHATCRHFNTGDMTDLFMSLVGTNVELEKKILTEKLDGIADHEAFGRKWAEEYKHVTSERPVPLKQGVVELLQHLTAAGTPRAIATSTNTDSAEDKLGRSGILEYFPVVIGGEKVPRSKPAPDIYLKVASILGVEPACCLALEDSNNGVRAAVSAGMTVVQVPDLIQPDEKILQLGSIVLDSLTDTLTYDF